MKSDCEEQEIASCHSYNKDALALILDVISSFNRYLTHLQVVGVVNNDGEIEADVNNQGIRTFRALYGTKIPAAAHKSITIITR